MLFLLLSFFESVPQLVLTTSEFSSTKNMFKTLSKRSIFAGSVAAFSAGYISYQRASVFAQAEEVKKTALNPADFVPFKLQEVLPITHNVKLYRFALPEEDQTLGTFVASCLVVYVNWKRDENIFLIQCVWIFISKAKIGDKDVIRPYTPTSSPDAKGHFDLMVKVVSIRMQWTLC